MDTIDLHPALEEYLKLSSAYKKKKAMADSQKAVLDEMCAQYSELKKEESELKSRINELAVFDTALSEKIEKSREEWTLKNDFMNRAQSKVNRVSSMKWVKGYLQGKKDAQFMRYDKRPELTRLVIDSFLDSNETFISAPNKFHNIFPWWNEKSLLRNNNLSKSLFYLQREWMRINKSDIVMLNADSDIESILDSEEAIALLRKPDNDSFGYFFPNEGVPNVYTSRITNSKRNLYLIAALGEFAGLTYFDSQQNKFASIVLFMTYLPTLAGYIVHNNKNKITIRKGLPVIEFYEGGIIHSYSRKLRLIAEEIGNLYELGGLGSVTLKDYSLPE